jgi:glutamate--cysteine ligase
MDTTPTLREEIARQVAALFAGDDSGEPGRIGAEVELLVFDRTADGGHGVVEIDRVRSVLATDPALVREARFSFEPGGQLELSPAPATSAADLASTLRGLIARTEALLGSQGIGILALPVDPWRGADELGLQTPKDRYLVMQRHFDEIGPAGRQMMRRTASFQVCIGLRRGRAGRDQWLLANLAAPALALAFGRPGSHGEDRLAIWRATDPCRTGYDGRQVDREDPAGAYGRFARDAAELRLPGLDAAPDRVAHHLTTLFPPVRPRGTYLELRFIDAQPAERMADILAVVERLLGHRETRDRALDIVGRDPAPLARWWSDAADGDPRARLAAQGRALLEVATGVARGTPARAPRARTLVTAR